MHVHPPWLLVHLPWPLACLIKIPTTLQFHFQFLKWGFKISCFGQFWPILGLDIFGLLPAVPKIDWIQYSIFCGGFLIKFWRLQEQKTYFCVQWLSFLKSFVFYLFWFWLLVKLKALFEKKWSLCHKEIASLAPNIVKLWPKKIYRKHYWWWN